MCNTTGNIILTENNGTRSDKETPVVNTYTASNMSKVDDKFQ